MALPLGHYRGLGTPLRNEPFAARAGAGEVASWNRRLWRLPYRSRLRFRWRPHQPSAAAHAWARILGRVVAAGRARRPGWKSRHRSGGDALRRMRCSQPRPSEHLPPAKNAGQRYSWRVCLPYRCPGARSLRGRRGASRKRRPQPCGCLRGRRCGHHALSGGDSLWRAAGSLAIVVGVGGVGGFAAQSRRLSARPSLPSMSTRRSLRSLGVARRR